MARLVLLGNSGSGKSTLAERLAHATHSPRLDLDTLAWEPGSPPRRRPLADSVAAIEAFTASGEAWVIEGCYADLLSAVLPRCTRLVFLNPGIEACVANARSRAWEPHKYPSRAAQDANLEMLVGWIREYVRRGDEFSLTAHRALFDRFSGEKLELVSREAIAAYR